MCVLRILQNQEKKPPETIEYIFPKLNMLGMKDCKWINSCPYNKETQLSANEVDGWKQRTDDGIKKQIRKDISEKDGFWDQI